VITGASKASQVVENMKALDVVPKLTNDVIERIEAILCNKPVAESNFR
jgi:aryl-alcohol dehydrogenase-like predicted oxidoreductase